MRHSRYLRRSSIKKNSLMWMLSKESETLKLGDITILKDQFSGSKNLLKKTQLRGTHLICLTSAIWSCLTKEKWMQRKLSRNTEVWQKNKLMKYWWEWRTFTTRICNLLKLKLCTWNFWRIKEKVRMYLSICPGYTSNSKTIKKERSI